MSDLCSHAVRGGGVCTLSAGHRGYHSTVTFGCDGCDKRRRGQPHATVLEPDHETVALAFCFLCVREDERTWRAPYAYSTLLTP